MTAYIPMKPKTFQSGDVVSRPGVSFDAHEGLALAMLDVEAGDAADVEDAMRKIIASAPEGTDVALVLILAISHAGDRALTTETAPEARYATH